MVLLSSLVKQFASAVLADYAGHILPSQRKALRALEHCRTESSPRMLAGCSSASCDHQVLVPHSCGHRLCPHCQHHESQQWLERQLKKLVPAEYFLVTFTLPAQFRGLAWCHQRTLYSLMIQCSWETLKTFAENDKQLQGMAGIISVLHTHSRCSDFHPHVHVVMPAAAIDAMKKVWRTKPKTKKKPPFLFHHKALAKVFRAKMLDGITQAGLTLPARYPVKWVVNCKSVGTGAKALTYLGRYLYRGVIQEKNILSCENGQVTFRYQDSDTKRWVYKTVPGAKFLWMILRHVLPKGFRRARNFGFLHPNSKRVIALIQYLARLDPNRALAWMRKRPQWVCPCCGEKMIIIQTRIPTQRPLASRWSTG